MAAPCKEHPHGAELLMPKAGSLKNELSEDWLAAGSLPGDGMVLPAWKLSVPV